jgi:hypothetical protein
LPRRQRLRLEPLEARQLLAGDLVISEFLASNDSDIRDEDRQRSDWIEILNAGSTQENLAGWSLTDNAADLTKWRFPEVILDPGDRIVVFASGKDRRDPAAPLHTNFRISTTGEYLGLVEPDGMTVAHDFGPSYPPQVRDVSYGLPQEKRELPIHAPGDTAKLFVPLNDALGKDWTAVGFDDSAWADAATGIGFGSAFADLVRTNVESQVRNLASGVYVRIPFELSADQSVFSLRLALRYNDGFVAYLNGVEVARNNVPDDVRADSLASRQRLSGASRTIEEFTLNDQIGSLHEGTNVLAIHVLNNARNSNNLLVEPQLVAGIAGELRIAERHFFPHPSAGEANGLGTTTGIWDVGHLPSVPQPGEAMMVFARALSTTPEVAPLMLHYRVMFGDETIVPMHDDGSHGDGAAGDGLYGGEIPAGIAAAGEMIRYRITGGEEGTLAFSRSPVFQDPLDTEEYFGTIVADPSIVSTLPVMHWFIEDTDAAGTAEGTYGSLFYDGEFYDNVWYHNHGFSTRGQAKESHEAEFPRDHHFRIADGVPRQDGVNILTNLGDPTLVRNTLAYEIYRQAGAHAHLAFPIRLEVNGEFRAIYDLVEDGDEEFLERLGLDPNGAMYKMENMLSAGGSQIQKRSREWEESIADLEALVEGLNLVDPLQRAAYVYDNIDIPQMVNFLVGMVIQADADCCGRNYYVYRDSDGTGEWTMIRWDVDKSLGRVDNHSPHNFEYRLDVGAFFAGRGNLLVDALLGNSSRLITEPGSSKPGQTAAPGFIEMYLTRLRTVLDDLVGPPGSETGEPKINQIIDGIADDLRADIPLEFDAWPQRTTLFSPAVPVPEWIEFGTWEGQVERFKNEYFGRRRDILYGLTGDMNFDGQVDTDDISEFILGLTDPDAYEARYGVPAWWRGDNDFTRLYQEGGERRTVAFRRLDYDDIARFAAAIKTGVPTSGVRLPDPQPEMPEIQFGQIDAAPESGNQADEFIELVNPNGFAVELSGWRLTGGVEYQFRPGVVLPAGGSLYVSPNVNAFRARSSGPSGGQGLFVQGDYSGEISNLGETIELRTGAGDVVASVTTPYVPSSAQSHLRISEIMYHPAGEPAGDAFEDDEYEFIELTNISATESLELAGVQFDRGIQYAFPEMTLGPGEHVLVVRNVAAFEERYGAGKTVAGQYGSAESPGSNFLDNAGESLRLVDALGGVIHEFQYDDAWFPETDGVGRSLEVVDPRETDLALWSEAVHWAASELPGGTPGEERPALESSATGTTSGTLLLETAVHAAGAAAETPMGEPSDAAAHDVAFTWEDSDGDGDVDFDDLPRGTSSPIPWHQRIDRLFAADGGA